MLSVPVPDVPVLLLMTAFKAKCLHRARLRKHQDRTLVWDTECFNPLSSNRWDNVCHLFLLESPTLTHMGAPPI